MICELNSLVAMQEGALTSFTLRPVYPRRNFTVHKQ